MIAGKKKVLAISMVAVLTGSLLVSVIPVSAAPITGTPYTSNEVYDVTVPHVIINQVYGGGLVADTGTYSTHGFIELYNQTNSDVNLSDWSLQYADNGSSKTGPTGPWEKLNLAGTIKAHSSFLIKAKATGSTSVKVNLTSAGDMPSTWDRFINNKGLKVVLMSNQANLEVANPFVTKPTGYVDMLGTGSNDSGSTIDGYEADFPTGSAEGTSKKKAIRRNNFTDTDNNKSDYVQIDYSTATPEEILLVKPRSGADGPWVTTITSTQLADSYIGSSYSYQVYVSGGQTPYTYTASNLPDGLSINSTTGLVTGTPIEGTQGSRTVIISVTDSASIPVTVEKLLAYTVHNEVIPFADTIRITELANYSVGTSNADGGVAEIVKYNKENGKFYLVNGSTLPPTLEIVSMTKSGQSVVFNKEKAIDVKLLSETNGFLYGDLTSVDVNTTTDRISVTVQESDATKLGRILVLDYDGNLLKSYDAGVQPDMIRSTADGRYILTADEGEPRTGVDPEGSITIVDTSNDSVTHVKFNDPTVIADDVHIRGESNDVTGIVYSPGTKADGIFDFEPEYITLNEDDTVAYVSLQENNAIATVNIASKTVASVKSLGLKNYNLPNNALDLLKNSQINLENVPFSGMYMPDGITSYQVNGETYLFTANEGDVTEWSDFRNNGSTIGEMKTTLNANSPAAIFLSDKGTTYDSVEVASDRGNDGIYMYGGRSFSVWNADTMHQVYDSGNDFEQVTAQRVPLNFNTSNSKRTMDDRSSKKGPEPEDIKVGKVGNKIFAFIGLERIGGLMTYDVTDPTQPTFASYINSRTFSTNVEAANGPEGIEFVPATISPTGLPLILVANEVGGTVSVLQMNITKVELNQSEISIITGAAAQRITATVTPVGNGAATVTWTSSNSAVATVDSSGNVTSVAAGTAIITAMSADGYGVAEAKVTVHAPAATPTPGPTVIPVVNPTINPTSSPTPSLTPSPTPTASAQPSADGNRVVAKTEVIAVTDSTGIATATVSNTQIDDALRALTSVVTSDKVKNVEIKAIVDSNANAAIIKVSAESFGRIADSDTNSVSIDAGIGLITFDKQSISTISAAAISEDIAISITKKSIADITNDLPAAALIAISDAVNSHPIFDFTLMADGKQVSNFAGGIVSISVPYAATANEDINAIIIYYIADNGDLVMVPNAVFNPATGTIKFTVSHFSHYAVSYNNVTFADTTLSFARDKITFLAARNIIQGVENNKFAPRSHITRADWVVILARLAEADLTKFTDVQFKDVRSDAYYAQAVQWAMEHGITIGTANGNFEPSALITREQMSVMIVRLSKFLQVTLPTVVEKVDYADEALIPTYALEAAQALQEAGIINGKINGAKTGMLFAPQDHATREEAAKMLALFLQLKVK